MKKLAYISGTTLPGGGPEHLCQLIKHINPQEWETVICTKNDGPYWDKLLSFGIKTYDLTLRELSLSTLVRLTNVLREEQPSLIHTHGKGPGLYGRCIGKLLNIPVVHTFHGFHYEALPTLTRWLHLLTERLLSLITSQHIFVCTGEKKRARVIKFLDEKNSTVIHNGVDCKYIQKLDIDRKTVLKSIDCEDWEQNKILGTISRFSPEKGILDLLSGFSQVIQSEPDLKLMIVGGYPEEHKNYYLKAKALIEKEHLTEHVRILGYRQDALKILKCMDFYISPSLSEGLPISLLEAFAAGVPVIATRIPGNKDILCNSDFGVLSDPGLPKSLAQGIRKMLAFSERERNIISQNAFNRVKSNFSVTTMTDKTFQLYRQVLNKART
ncbi:MAG: glycosyltransferase [Nitrospinaceae bacterium]|jgi:glycosyltransferase involved in cell wall biosynthesis|nr:glycosyltransferase [Nitrospinaceae bacterium]|tara:strand:+ start:119 stop:1267 length:1149 start_codon:yes stop_codon:yes gene_type:complete